MAKRFSYEELKRFTERGTLESMILSHGLLPLKVLEDLLLQTDHREQYILELEKENDVLNNIIEDYELLKASASDSKTF